MASNNSEDYWRCPFCENVYHFFTESDIDEHNAKCGEKQKLIKELKKQENGLEKVVHKSLAGHLHINKNEVELGLLSQRQLKKSIAEKETELQTLHRRSWSRAESNGSVKTESQQCKGCAHSHSQVLSEHNYANFSPKKRKNVHHGRQHQQNGGSH